MSAFSLGPWEWDLCDGGQALLSAAGKVAYADRHGIDVCVPNEHDARLIAAAPKLFEELCDRVATAMCFHDNDKQAAKCRTCQTRALLVSISHLRVSPAEQED